jgi:hypothetical protein
VTTRKYSRSIRHNLMTAPPMVTITQTGLETVIANGLACQGNKNLNRDQIAELVGFIINYYTPVQTAILSVQFLGDAK